MQRNQVFNKNETKMKKKHPEGEKTSRQAEDWCTVKHVTLYTLYNSITRKTTDQHRTADSRRINRETNEGNEGDTAGATETMNWKSRSK